MANRACFADNDAQLWFLQQPTNGSNNVSNNSYPTEQQQMHPEPNYNQIGSNQDFSGSTSLLETLLRHGRDAVGQDYVNPGGNPGVPLGGQNMSNVSCQSAPYTPTSSTDRVSPIVAYVPDAQERVRQQEIQNQYMLNQQGYPIQQYPNSYVTPSMAVASNSPTNYGVQQNYAAYANGQVNERRNPNETNELANGQAQQHVDYPWMKSYSAGLWNNFNISYFRIMYFCRIFILFFVWKISKYHRGQSASIKICRISWNFYSKNI